MLSLLTCIEYLNIFEIFKKCCPDYNLETKKSSNLNIVTSEPKHITTDYEWDHVTV